MTNLQEEILYLIGNQVITKKNLITVVSADLKINKTNTEELINAMIIQGLLVNTYGDVNAFEMYEVYKLSSKLHTLPEYE